MPDGTTSTPTEYKRKLCEIEDIAAPDDLCQGICVCGAIIVSGTGEYKRGEILMSEGSNVFTKAAVSGIPSAKEICVLSEDLEIEDNGAAVSAGYFFGEYSKKRIMIDGENIDADVMPALRAKGIFAR